MSLYVRGWKLCRFVRGVPPRLTTEDAIVRWQSRRLEEYWSDRLCEESGRISAVQKPNQHVPQ